MMIKVPFKIEFKHILNIKIQWMKLTRVFKV